MNYIRHLAIIMDGNARWAEARALPTLEGHKCGAENVKKLLSAIIQYNIPYLTLYTFSSENWQRSEAEVKSLINLLETYLDDEIVFFHKNGIRLKIIGEFTRLKLTTQQKINNIIELTKCNNQITVCIAFSYGSRAEIVQACNNIITCGAQNVTEDNFSKYLYDPDMPDVDLLIRCGGVLRISNFLLWQLAYAELFFTKKYWPDFTADDLAKALEDYHTRTRTFGKR